jgi:hypothetical protein
VLAAVSLLLLAGCNSVFFQPNRIGYTFPQQFGLEARDVHFASADGTRLTAWFLPAQGPSRGTVVFFHGNAANITNHLPVVRWLPSAGYAVFLFDYRGYGLSEGQPTRTGVIADGVAALDHVRARPDVDAQRLVVYGQSLGGAVAIGALARAGTDGVRALVVEGAFGSYREVARRVLNRVWLTWPIQYPAAWLLFSDDLRPYEDLPALAHLPFLVVHSRADGTVPFAAGEALYAAFPGPDKTLWAPEDGRHGDTFLRDDSPWRAQLLDYLAQRLDPPTRR